MHVAAVYQICLTLDASSVVLRPVRQALVLLCLVVFSTGCALAPSYRAHPSFSERFSRVKSVAIGSGKIDVFYLDTSGLPEKRDEWSDQGRANILAAIQAELQSKTGNNLLVKLPEQAKAESRDSLERIYALFEAVSQSIILHTYSPNTEYQFEDKIKNFDYSLGPEVIKIAGEDSDSLLLVTGRDHVWSEGRKALQTLGVIIGVGAGVATGVAVVPRLGGGTVLQAALEKGVSPIIPSFIAL